MVFLALSSCAIQPSLDEQAISKEDWCYTDRGYQTVGEEEKAEMGIMTVLEYSVRLINNELIYTSEETSLKEFVVEKGEVEPG